jgi:hypothetical protein
MCGVGGASASEMGWRDIQEPEGSPYEYSYAGTMFSGWKDNGGNHFVSEHRCKFSLGKDGYIHFETSVLRPDVSGSLLHQVVGYDKYLYRIHKTGRIFTQRTASRWYIYDFRSVQTVFTYKRFLDGAEELAVSTSTFAPYYGDECFGRFRRDNTDHLHGLRLRQMLLEFKNKNFVVG